MAQALKNRKADTIVAAFQTIHNIYKPEGVAPNTYMMDNDISCEFIAASTKTSLHIS